MPYVTLINGNRIEARDEFTGEAKGFEFDVENKKVLADFGDGSAPKEIGGMTPEQTEALDQAVADISQLKTDVARAESKADAAGEVANTKLDNSVGSHTEGMVPVANVDGQLVDSYINNDNVATNAGIESSKLAFTSAQSSALASGIDATKVAQIQQNSDDIGLVEAKATHADAEAERIGKLIPSTATMSNQLADKAFVNSSIATSTATFRGTFNSLAALEAYTGEKDENDYAFVVETVGSATVYKRYKFDGSAWVFEYELNNSSFTAAQWATINSGATSGTVAQVETNRTNIIANTNKINTLNASASTQGSVANKIATALTTAGDGNTIDANSSGKLEAIGLLNANGSSPIKVWEGSESAWENGETNDWFGWSNSSVASQIDEDKLPSEMPTGYTYLAYGTSRLLCSTYQTPANSIYYSDDKGLTWVAGTAPSKPITKIIFHKGNFVAYDEDGGIHTREELSDTWVSRGYVYAFGYRVKDKMVATSNKLFCIVANSNTVGLFESSDIGATWTEVVSDVVDNALGSFSTNYIYIGSNESTIIITSGNLSIYSTDEGITWQQGGQLHETDWGWEVHPLNNGTFVATHIINIKYTEDNGVTWKSGANFPGTSAMSVLKDLGGSIIASNGNRFYSGNYYLTSWTSVKTLSSNQLCRNFVIMDNKLIGCIEQTHNMLTFTNDATVIYTDSTDVSSSSTVYSAPKVASSNYSIRYKSGNTLNVYDSAQQKQVNFTRDSQSDQTTTTSIGELHPDWLCNIENVGVKFGNKLIADASGSLVVDQVYDATSPNAQSGVAIAGAGFASNSDLASAINSLTSAINDKVDIQVYTTKMSSVDQSVNLLDSSVSSLNSSVGTLNTNVSTNTTDISSIDTKIGDTALPSGYTTLTQAILGLSNTIGSLSTNLGSLGTDVTNLQSSYTSLSGDLSSLTTLVNTLSNDYPVITASQKLYDSAWTLHSDAPIVNTYPYKQVVTISNVPFAVPSTAAEESQFHGSLAYPAAVVLGGALASFFKYDIVANGNQNDLQITYYSKSNTVANDYGVDDGSGTNVVTTSVMVAHDNRRWE